MCVCEHGNDGSLHHLIVIVWINSNHSPAIQLYLLSAVGRKEKEWILYNIDRIADMLLMLTGWHHKLPFTFITYGTVQLAIAASLLFG